MKNIRPHYLITLLLLFATQVAAFGSAGISVEATESVKLFTDRSIYIVGEQVGFYAKIHNSVNIQPSENSQVLYCELISPDGNKISGSKFLINQASVEGCIAIPEEQVSGIYFLRAYTKVMRNYGPETYAYVQIKIVNPSLDEVLAPEKNEKNTVLQLQESKKDINNDLFAVELNKKQFTSNETVSVFIKAKENHSLISDGICLSVMHEAAIPQTMLTQQNRLKQKAETMYVAENLGLSLTGKLTASGGFPLKGKLVNLSIVGQGSDFMAIRTDSSGRFFFVLPAYSGKRDLFLCAEKTDMPDVRIWVDNDFCSLPVHIQAEAFTLSDEERSVALKMAVNCQIESDFDVVDTVMENTPAVSANRTFYGEPTSVLNLDRYVQLPTLEEYFNELPGQVKVRKKSGLKYFKVIGSYDISFYDPLVLIDGVAVDEPDRVLAVAPQNIARIEIVNQLYVKGGQTYGGVINIVSKKGDFAGIDLPATGIFINFRFFAQKDIIQPIAGEPDKVPDVKNTLLWKPGISVPENGEFKCAFPAPKATGKYAVVLDGISNNGEQFRQIVTFEVKN